MPLIRNMSGVPDSGEDNISFGEMSVTVLQTLNLKSHMR